MVISAAINPVTVSGKVMVKVIGDWFVTVPEGETVAVGAVLSNVKTTPFPTKELPALSVAVAVTI